MNILYTMKREISIVKNRYRFEKTDMEMRMFTYCGREYTVDGMGLFTTDEEWIHPEKCEITYEIIFVTEGNVTLCEAKKSGESDFSDATEYILAKGDAVVLYPGVFHKGIRVSAPPTSFYWLHFFAAEDERERLPKVVRDYGNSALFRELLHLKNMPAPNADLINAVFLHILADLSDKSNKESGNALAEKVYEWIRINADARLTVEKTAAHFGYNSEYLSRLMSDFCGAGAKKLIDRFTLSKANELLGNTHLYVKEIAERLGFPDASAFVNYYRYHEKRTPGGYRNLYTKTHMNKR